MKDNNAKAPKVRSGDDINPVVGSIVKIGAIVLISALIVLIVVVTVQLIQNSKAAKDIFSEDRIVVSKTVYEQIVNADVEVEDITDASVRRVLTENDEDVVIHFYFYYSNLTKETLKDKKDEITRLNALDKNEPVFIVDLYEVSTEENQGNLITDILRRDERLNEGPIEIGNVLDFPDTNTKYNKKYLTFVISMDYNDRREKESFTLVNGNEVNGSTKVLTLLNTLKEKEEE